MAEKEMLEEIAYFLRESRALLVIQNPDGDWSVCKMGLTDADAARVLYASADAVVERMPPLSVWSH